MATYSTSTETQAAHGFLRGELLRFQGPGWVRAQANSEASLARAIVVLVRDADRFDVAMLSSGVLAEITGHGLGADGAQLYLSQSIAGAATSTAPTSGIVQVVGQVRDANKLLLGAPAAVSL